MTARPFCSIIISCFNKALYVAAAIQSALLQSYDQLEVIVVDDGSTDESGAIIAGFAKQITFIRQANRGQAAALNVGFAKCQGEIIFFLDGDDLLDPDVVQRVVAVWTDKLAKVHFHLRVIDDAGAHGATLIPPYRPLLGQDVAKAFWRFGLYPSPPMSGNAFSRRLLTAVMPLPEDVYRTSADLPLIGVAPLFGQIAALAGSGGSYRRGDNNSSRGGLDKVEINLIWDDHYIRLALRHLSQEASGCLAAAWPMHLKHKLIFTKFKPQSARSGRYVIGIASLYIRSVLLWPEYSSQKRLVLLVWAVVITVVPRSILRRILGIAGQMIQVV